MNNINVRSQNRWELLFIAALAALVFWISGEFDLLEQAFNWTREHEELELDEIIVTAAFLCLALLVFYLRRLTESRRLSRKLEEKNQSLETAMSEIRQLEKMLPICSACKKIRDDKGYWQQVDQYFQSRSNTEFTHTMCPDCLEKFYGDQPWFEALKNDQE